MSLEGSYLYKFREFRLDLGETELLRDGKQIAITPKAFHLLRILVQNHGSVVKKDKLISEIWKDSFVEEGNLAFTARMLRKALDDDAKHPVFIETVPRKGYRFIADVSKDPDPAEVETGENGPEQLSEAAGIPLLKVALLILTVGVAASAFYLLRHYSVSTASTG